MDCEKCALTKVDNRPTKAETISIKPEGIFEFLAVDICGPFQTTNEGNKYIVCFIDLFSKFVICKALPKREAPILAKISFEEVIARYGFFYKLL